jgi:uncharacterized membrane protein YphA (DoxX/SURF4 family)
MRIVSPGHGLFVLAGIGIAVLSHIYGDLTPMWEFFLPDSMPMRGTWIEGFALLMLAASAGLCFPRTALPSALAICAYYLACAVTRVDPIVAEPFSVGAWYGFCEAMTGFAGVRILYAMLQLQPGAKETPPAMGKRGVRRAQIVFGLTCAFYGLSHFVYADYTAGMVPTYLPAPLGLAYFTGIGHAAAGIAIVVGILPRLAATLEAIMMSLFGLLVWLPTFFTQSPPAWATPPQGQWTEIVINLLLAACAWLVAESLRNRPWRFGSR